MSMRIQDAISNCCDGIKHAASSTANWIGKTVTTTGSFVIEGARKVAEVVKPHFESLKTFARDNKQSILITAIAFTVGAIATAIMTHLFCRGTGTTPLATAGTEPTTMA